MSWKSTYNGYNPSKAAGFINPSKVVYFVHLQILLLPAERLVIPVLHTRLSLSPFCLFFFFWQMSPNQAVNFSSLFMEITCLLTCEGNVLYAREAQEPRTSSLSQITSLTRQ